MYDVVDAVVMDDMSVSVECGVSHAMCKGDGSRLSLAESVMTSVRSLRARVRVLGRGERGSGTGDGGTGGEAG